jgi:hypothetical protein
MKISTETEHTQELPEIDDSHDVTAKDQLWLILAAILPIAVATIWYVQR